MKDRLLKLLNEEQLSYARFAESIGVQPSGISHILSGRNKPGFDFIQKILIHYPSVNAEWLILGKGSMYKRESTQGLLFGHEQKAGHGDIQAHGMPFPAETRESETSRNTVHKDPLQAEPEEKTRTFTNVDNNVSPRDYKSESSGNQGAITNVNSPKIVEKIVIFYSDRSFSEYSPG